jgi:hypothetical protein
MKVEVAVSQVSLMIVLVIALYLSPGNASPGKE